MDSSIRLRQNFIHHWNVIFSLMLLGISCSYFLAGLYSVSNHYEGAFIVTSSYFRLFDLTVNIISNLQTAVFFIWVSIGALLVFSSRKYWWLNLICVIVTVPIFFIGTIFGSPHLKNVHTIAKGTLAYHLNYIYDGDDGYGYYNLLQCDSLDVSCQQLFKSYADFRNLDKNAHLETDESRREVSVIIEGKTVYRYTLD